MTYVCELWNLKRPRSGPEYGFSVRDGVVHFDYDDGSLFVDAANEMQYVVTNGDLRFSDVHDLLRIRMAKLHLWECDLYKVCPTLSPTWTVSESVSVPYCFSKGFQDGL